MTDKTLVKNQADTNKAIAEKTDTTNEQPKQMGVRNKSERLVHFGTQSILPGATVGIDDTTENRATLKGDPFLELADVEENEGSESETAQREAQAVVDANKKTATGGAWGAAG